MKDYLLINLENDLIDEFFNAEDAGCDLVLGIVFNHLMDKARHETTIELEEETVDIIKQYGDYIDNDETNITIVALPTDKGPQMKLLAELKKYYDEYQPVKEKWENWEQEDDDDTDYSILSHMASNYEDIDFMIKEAGNGKTPVVVIA